MHAQYRGKRHVPGRFGMATRLGNLASTFADDARYATNDVALDVSRRVEAAPFEKELIRAHPRSRFAHAGTTNILTTSQ
jgi:hypothetical protein